MRYVVGCTEDERGREAIALARALARAPGAELDLVHVLPGPGDQLRLAQEREYQQYLAGQADVWLDKALALVPADVTARVYARSLTKAKASSSAAATSSQSTSGRSRRIPTQPRWPT